MKSEREDFNKETGDYSNGYRSRKAFGDKKMIELQVSCHAMVVSIPLF